jgi:hypothetical protein
LLVPWPLDLYHKDGKKFVIPKYGFWVSFLFFFLDFSFEKYN